MLHLWCKTILCFLAAVKLWACTHTEKPAEDQHPAQIYCGSCHQFPEPALLDKNTWENSVLPQMALRMGIAPQNINDPKIQQAYYEMTETGLYPSPPMLSKEAWHMIEEYFLALSPDSLPKVNGVVPYTSIFSAQTPEVSFPSAVSSLHFNPSINKFLIGGAGQLLTLDDQLQVQSFPTQGKLLTFIQELPFSNDLQQKLLLTFLGDGIRPGMPPSGEVVEAIIDTTKSLHFNKINLPSISRITQATYTDLAGDSIPELLTCNFGYLEGRLSYWKKNESNAFEEYILSNEPGALKAIPKDFNEDGLRDIMAIWGQGNERISLFLNRGEGKFEERVLLQFPPSYGSSYFELADFDKDGLNDILYTCGDNADFSTILKPYHGVYIFKNLGDHQYEKVYFYPMHGTYKAVARDFDNDGDLDIAAIAFFADFNHHPEKSFVFLENQDVNNYQFQPGTANIHHLGRWMTLETGDFDNDGDLDLILGSYTMNTTANHPYATAWKKGAPFVVLQNNAVQ